MDTTSIRRLLQQAVQFQISGDTTQAEQCLRSVQHAAPQNPDAWHLLGVLALQRGKFAGAAELIQQAIACDPTNADFHYNLAGAFFSLGEWAKAADAYQRAAELNPDFFEAHKGQGAALAKMSRWREAGEALARSLSIHPDQFSVLLDLADALEQQGRNDDAVERVKRALLLEPSHPDAHRRMVRLFAKMNDRRNLEMAHYNLGVTLQRAGHTAEAIASYREALRLNPDHAKAAHQLAALTGRTPRTAPAEYVVDLFNEYAHHFDEHLEQLEYRVPELLRAAVGRLLPPGRPAGRVLDLGCGAGKCGALFRDLATHLTGVDLAPKMIEAAHQRGVYDELQLRDITEAMRGSSHCFDLLIAADVFIYVGAVDEVFAEAGRICPRGGLFAFSVESCAGDGFVLRKSGRFAHAPAHLELLARRNGFEVALQEPVAIRLQQGQPIPGFIYVLRRNQSPNQVWAAFGNPKGIQKISSLVGNDKPERCGSTTNGPSAAEPPAKRTSRDTAEARRAQRFHRSGSLRPLRLCG